MCRINDIPVLVDFGSYLVWISFFNTFFSGVLFSCSHNYVSLHGIKNGVPEGAHKRQKQIRNIFFPSVFNWLKALVTIFLPATTGDPCVLFLHKRRKNFALEMENDMLDFSQPAPPWGRKEKSHWCSHHVELWCRHELSVALPPLSMTCSHSLAYVHNTRNLLIKTTDAYAHRADSN